MTFNAPKSVSILALLPDGDKHLIELHQQAVDYAMQQFECEFAETRIIKGGEVVFQKTHNLIYGSLCEMASREGDPHLHTHTIVMNVTQGRDKKWRALSSDLSRSHGTYENAWNYRNVFGAIYRNKLADLIVAHGYQIESPIPMAGLKLLGFLTVYGNIFQNVVIKLKRGWQNEELKVQKLPRQPTSRPVAIKS